MISNMVVTQNKEAICQKLDQLKIEVKDYQSQINSLENEYNRASSLHQLLARLFTIGSVKELVWTRIKLGIVQKEIDQYEAQFLSVSSLEKSPSN